MKLEDIQKLTPEELDKARLKFNPSLSDFSAFGTGICCNRCEYRTLKVSESSGRYHVCKVLNIPIANPVRSACDLFEDDGIPF